MNRKEILNELNRAIECLVNGEPYTARGIIHDLRDGIILTGVQE